MIFARLKKLVAMLTAEGRAAARQAADRDEVIRLSRRCDREDPARFRAAR